MKIEIVDGIAKIFTPYNGDFVTKIKGIGGRKWNAADKCWQVPESEIETVRQYMLEVYGETDQTNDDKINIIVTFLEDAVSPCNDVVLFGKTIATATGKASGAKVGNDVTFLSGEPGSGGSNKNWYTLVPEGCVVKIRDVAPGALKIPTEYNITIKNQERNDARQVLLDEKKRLLARIAEIDKLLEEG